MPRVGADFGRRCFFLALGGQLPDSPARRLPACPPGIVALFRLDGSCAATLSIIPGFDGSGGARRVT